MITLDFTTIFMMVIKRVIMVVKQIMWPLDKPHNRYVNPAYPVGIFAGKWQKKVANFSHMTTGCQAHKMQS